MENEIPCVPCQWDARDYLEGVVGSCSGDDNADFENAFREYFVAYPCTHDRLEHDGEWEPPGVSCDGHEEDLPFWAGPLQEEELELCDACLKQAVESAARVSGRTHEGHSGTAGDPHWITELRRASAEHPCPHQGQEPSC